MFQKLYFYYQYFLIRRKFSANSSSYFRCEIWTEFFLSKKGDNRGSFFWTEFFLSKKGDNRVSLFSSAIFFSKKGTIGVFFQVPFSSVFSSSSVFFRVSFFQLLCTETVGIWLLNGVLRLMRRIIVQILLKFLVNIQTYVSQSQNSGGC